MSEERVESYADALLSVARAEGRLQEVEDELLGFSQALERSDELRMALTDPQLPVERRVAVVEELMGGKALVTSTALAAFIVGAGRTHDLPAIVSAFVEKSAEGRDHEVAEVRSAVALDAAQRDRLAAALNEATGKKVEIKVVVDPSVLGGLVTRVGDTVIDGSVRHRLEQMKEQIS
jgi:F-type H+-transporting ATPase subunit delta